MERNQGITYGTYVLSAEKEHYQYRSGICKHDTNGLLYAAECLDIRLPL